jgi:hypothetical protein
VLSTDQLRSVGEQARSPQVGPKPAALLATEWRTVPAWAEE